MKIFRLLPFSFHLQRSDFCQPVTIVYDFYDAVIVMMTIYADK